MDRALSKEYIQHKRLRKLLMVLVIICIACVAIWGIKKLMDTSIDANSLKLCKIDTGSLEICMEAAGEVVPIFEEIISSPINSRVLEVYHYSGDTVNVGTPLLKLDLQDAKQNYEKMLDEEKMKVLQMEQQRLSNQTDLSEKEMRIRIKEMEINRLESNLKSERFLDSLGSSTLDQVRLAEQSLQTAKLELEQQRTQYENAKKAANAEYKLKQLELEIFRKTIVQSLRLLNDAEIRSPRRATLTYITTQIGSSVSQGSQVAIISDLNHFKIKASLSEFKAKYLHTGAKAKIEIAEKFYDAKVGLVAPNSKDGLVAFELELDSNVSQKLHAGLRTNVYVVKQVRNKALRMRVRGFYNGPGEYTLYVHTKSNELMRRLVTLGEADYNFVEVISGLKEGEEVAINDMSKYHSPIIKIKNHD